MTRTMMALAGFLLALGLATFGVTATAQGDDIDADPAVAADADDIDREGQRCISVTRLAETHAIDDQTILFYMHTGEVYQNVLRYSCRGLKRENRIAYSVTANRLCRTDFITVLQRFGGGIDPGISCGLGEFVQISEEEAEFLRYGERSGIMEEPEAVELPEDDSQDDGAKDDGA